MERNFFLSFQRTISRGNRTSVKEGRFPFRQTFWKFWLGAKWIMILWFAPLENSRKSGTSKKVFLFSRLECSEWIFVFHYHDSCISYQFQVHRKKFVAVIWGKNGLQWISLQFAFSVLTKWNCFQIMNAFLLELVGMWCLK